MNIIKGLRKMTGWQWLLPMLAVMVIMSACPDSPTNPKDENPYKQEPIDWPSLADSPWPMYRGNPQLNGRSNIPGPQEGIISRVVPKSGIYSKKAFTSFAIGEDSVIYFGSSYDPINEFNSSQTWYIYAMNTDGSIKWKFRDTDANIYMVCGPLITNDGKIVFAADKYIYNINQNGELVWKYAVLGNVFTPGLTIDKAGNIYFCDEFGNGYSIDTDGNLRWKINHDENFHANGDLAISISPDGKTTYFPASEDINTTLYAISTEGDLQWTFYCGDSTATIITSPVVDCQGNIYFGVKSSAGGNDKEGFYSLSPDGTIRWQFSHNISWWIEPTIDQNGNIYFCAEDIYSFTNAGQQRFFYPVNDYITCPLNCDNRGNIYAISNIFYILSSDGYVISQLTLPCEVFANPAFGYSNIAYVGASCENANILFSIK